MIPSSQFRERFKSWARTLPVLEGLPLCQTSRQQAYQAMHLKVLHSDATDRIPVTSFAMSDNPCQQELEMMPDKSR